MRAAILAIASVLSLTLLAPPAVAELRWSREQAIRNLAKPDTGVRRKAVARLAEVGTMGDTPLLLKALNDPDDTVRALAETALWDVWSRSGDPAVDRMFQSALDELDRQRIPEAVDLLTEVIRVRPAFAEGWNKRATAWYVLGEYRKALADCDEVIKRNPAHFGALAGCGQVLLRMEQPEKALGYFRRALRINPNLEDLEATVEELSRIVATRRARTI